MTINPIETSGVETSEGGIPTGLPVHAYLSAVEARGDKKTPGSIVAADFVAQPRDKSKDHILLDQPPEVAAPVYVPSPEDDPIPQSFSFEDDEHEQSPLPAEAPATDETEELALPSLSAATYYKMLATEGIKRVLPRVRRFREAASSFKNEKTESLKDHSWGLLALGSVASALALSKVSNLGFFKGEINKERRRKLRNIGGAAVLLAAAGGIAYATQRGLHNPSTAHEAVKPTSTPNIDLTNEFKLRLPLHVQAVVAQVGHLAYRAHQVRVHAGDGYTQILAKYYHGKSPTELYHAYKEGIKHLGPNFIRGVHHYTMANHDFGLFQGKAHLSAQAVKFFAHFRWHR